MNTLRKRLILVVAVLICSASLIGCKGVPVVQVEEPLQPVVSNIAKYEAPERSTAPAPQGGSGLG